MLPGHVLTAANGMRGFDANRVITVPVAKAFRDAGYQFCVRYVRRQDPNSFDLSAAEARRLLDADFALMPVQHVASEVSWTPTPAKGTRYGNVAASECAAIGIPAGVTVWCDLEGVAVGTPVQDVIDYCNRWHSAVAGGGYVPGLYVGFHAGLSAKRLFNDLRFTHYWGAFNLNADEVPVTRGLQMKQSVRKAADLVPGFDFEFQVDRVKVDALGGRPTMLAPESWMG